MKSGISIFYLLIFIHNKCGNRDLLRKWLRSRNGTLFINFSDCTYMYNIFVLKNPFWFHRFILPILDDKFFNKATFCWVKAENNINNNNGNPKSASVDILRSVEKSISTVPHIFGIRIWSRTLLKILCSGNKLMKETKLYTKHKYIHRLTIISNFVNRTLTKVS